MSWMRPVVSFSQGAAITLGSTAVSCALALQVEKSAHRLFFWVAPHWYARVDQAYGLTEEDLQYARLAAQQREIQQVGDLAQFFAMDYAILPTDDYRWTSISGTSSNNGSSTPPLWWNKVRIPSDEERILDSAPL